MGHAIALGSACGIRIVYQGGRTLRALGVLRDHQTLATGGNEAGRKCQGHCRIEGTGVNAIVIIIEFERPWGSGCGRSVGAEDWMEIQ